MGRNPAAGGYNTKPAVQPAGVVTAAEVICSAALLAAMAPVTILLFWFDLDRKYPERMKKIGEREAAKA